MKVWLVIAQENLPGVDPGARPWRVSMLAQALGQAGHDVTIWLGAFNHTTRRRRPLDDVRLDERRTVRMVDGPGYQRSISWKRIRHNRVQARDFRARAAGAEPPDLVVVCLPVIEMAEAAVAYAQERGIPCVVDVRDTWPDLYLRAVPRPLRRVFRALIHSEFARARRALSGATAITAVSRSYLDWALHLARRAEGPTDAVFVIGYPADGNPPEAQPAPVLAAIPDDALVVTFVGTFGASYDLDTVLDAATRLRERPDLWFVLAGDGDSFAALARRAAGLDRVILPGWLSHDQLIALLDRSTLGLAAYAAGAMQSLPNKPFEYLQAGVPIVSSLPGELDSLVETEKVGATFRPGDAAGLAGAIEDLVASPAELAATSTRARRLFDLRFRSDRIYPAMSAHVTALVRDDPSTSRPSTAAAFPVYVHQTTTAGSAGPLAVPDGLVHCVLEGSAGWGGPLGRQWRRNGLLVRVSHRRARVHLLTTVDGRIVHRCVVHGRDFRYPFMARSDRMIGGVWTDPDFRGRGLATLMTRWLVATAEAGSSVWYLTEAGNAASRRVAEGSGLRLAGHAQRAARVGVRQLGSYVLSDVAAR